MTAIKFKPALILLFLFLLSCSYTQTQINRAEDKKEALKFTEEFYNLLKNNDYEPMYSLFGKSNKYPSIEEQNKALHELFIYQKESFGQIMDIQPESCNTKVVEGADSKSGEYKLTFFVTRTKSKKKFRDSFLLLFENGQIRIASFNITPI